jgi:hypothetical protein
MTRYGLEQHVYLQGEHGMKVGGEWFRPHPDAGVYTVRRICAGLRFILLMIHPVTKWSQPSEVSGSRSA